MPYELRRKSPCILGRLHRVDGGKFAGSGERRRVSLGGREGRAEIYKSYSRTGCQSMQKKDFMLRFMKK